MSSRQNQNKHRGQERNVAYVHIKIQSDGLNRKEKSKTRSIK